MDAMKIIRIRNVYNVIIYLIGAIAMWGTDKFNTVNFVYFIYFVLALFIDDYIDQNVTLNSRFKLQRGITILYSLFIGGYYCYSCYKLSKYASLSIMVVTLVFVYFIIYGLKNRR
ncbi:hypothetical protein EDD63_10279 [Breznakia blatticola]|uniref:Uncharacterized protein n=1 Tax=Breznakia blatticola TaxID=1754012 RepID=A0A4R8A8Q9_9FIRM|nr:hypothetical protein EDD63_10279 [Breznakia blatticola]